MQEEGQSAEPGCQEVLALGQAGVSRFMAGHGIERARTLFSLDYQMQLLLLQSQFTSYFFISRASVVSFHQLAHRLQAIHHLHVVS